MTADAMFPTIHRGHFVMWPFCRMTERVPEPRTEVTLSTVSAC